MWCSGRLQGIIFLFFNLHRTMSFESASNSYYSRFCVHWCDFACNICTYIKLLFYFLFFQSIDLHYNIIVIGPANSQPNTPRNKYVIIPKNGILARKNGNKFRPATPLINARSAVANKYYFYVDFLQQCDIPDVSTHLWRGLSLNKCAYENTA